MIVHVDCVTELVQRLPGPTGPTVLLVSLTSTLVSGLRKRLTSSPVKCYKCVRSGSGVSSPSSWKV